MLSQETKPGQQYFGVHFGESVEWDLEVECWNGRFLAVVRIPPAKKIEPFGLKKSYVFGEQSQEEENATKDS